MTTGSRGTNRFALRHAADWRSVAVLLFTATLGVVQWNLGYCHPVLYPLSLFLALTVAVIAHNHNHVSMWKWKPLNVLTNYIISIHYGHPAIAWVPTHNQGHHHYNNKPGDASRSPKWFKSNHLLALLIYPPLTGLAQSAEIRAFFKTLWHRNRGAFWLAASEYGVFVGFMGVIFALDWRKALLFYLLPQQFSQYTIQLINYIQHVEADAYSDWNHSRNFVSRTLNVLLFNNGYHTVHHLKPGAHWTQTPALHAEHAAKIKPPLLQRSVWGYLGWTFLLRPFVPGAGAPSLSETSASPHCDRPIADFQVTPEADRPTNPLDLDASERPMEALRH